MRLVELGRFREGAINWERLVGSVYQMRHDFVVHQGVCTLLQIAPHEKLGEGEQANLRALDDIPAVEVADGPAQGIENTRDVDALGLLGQWVQTRNLYAEVAREQFEQGGIHARLIIALADAKAFAY